MRRLYREGERDGAFVHSPFDPDGMTEFFDWLNEPALEAATPIPLSRFWFDLYRERSDLQAVFPDLPTEISEYMRWIDGHGRQTGDVRGLMPQDTGAGGEPGAGGLPADAGNRAPLGVNVAGFLQSELGIGEAGRGLISGLDAVRVPVLPVHGDWRPSSRQGHEYAMFDTDAAAFPINVVCVNADVLGHWAAQAGEEFFANRYTIGFWWWEVLAFPREWLPAFELVDEVWAATDHVADALMPVSTVPVTKITMPVTAPALTHRSRLELGLPEGFLFMFLFDHHSIFERKNPLAAIEAFKRAFPPDSGPSLVVKSINHEFHPHAHERLLLAAAEHPDVHLLDNYVSARDKNAMIASADCYVSLHRAEGFGLTMAEAMCLGKPVIATRYGGNLDFMDDRNSWLVDCRMVPIGAGQKPYPAEGEWADPDLDQAAHHMRSIFADPAAARDRGARAARHMHEAHSPLVAGRSMQRRLEHIHARRGQWPRRQGAAAPPRPELERLAGLVAGGGLAPARSRGLRSSFRRLVLRLMKPYTAYQLEVDRAVVEGLGAALEEASAAGDALLADRRRAARREAAQLAEMRRHAARLEELRGVVEGQSGNASPQGIEPENGETELDPRVARRTMSGA